MTILITGVAGFIGFHVASKILRLGKSVVGIDNLNPYYDVTLKKNRLEQISQEIVKFDAEYAFERGDICDKQFLSWIFDKYEVRSVIHLAAQAGVRHSITNPMDYINSNLIGFANILECCRSSNVEHLVYASSSSVYGGNKDLPFSESHSVDHPVSLYAATKKSNELMAHSYSHLYNIPTSGLRFFTAYGPWGRPDMALFIFTRAILNNKPIQVYNNGDMIRDFTYIDDIVESIIRVHAKPPELTNHPTAEFCSGDSWAPYNIFNVGNGEPVQLLRYIQALESCLDIKANLEYLPMQPGDVPVTSADTSKLLSWTKFKPTITVEEGVAKFVEWYKSYH